MQKRGRTPKASGSRRKKAATQDILGTFAPTEIKPKWKKYYRRLSELRDDLSRQKGTLALDAQEENSSYSLHMADAATDSFDRDFALSLLSAEQNALYEIEQAMARIQTGSYGVCEITGKPIGAERLEAIPWTRYSTEALRKLEQERPQGRARLNPRAAVTSETAPMEEDAEAEEA